ncbi:MAG TPA: extracellular solute-binding protein [Thermodesulfobacteriota bacterium]
MRTRTWLASALAAAAAIAVGATAGVAAEVAVYWERGSYWPGTAFDDFTKTTGIKVTFPIKGEKNEGYEAIKAEGPATRADLIITNNVANLADLKKRGLLSQVESRTIAANVPAYLRDPELYWFGLAARTRAIVYSTERVKRSELSTYAALGKSKWKGRLCLRSGTSPYNTYMLGTWIARMGESATETVVKGWLANNPHVFDGDTAQLKAIATGRCDVGIAHTYYLARLLANDPKFPVGVFWPDQQGAGVNVGVAGAAVTTHARHRAEAIRLIEFLTTPEAQRAFADANFEFPVNSQVTPHPILAAWGPFKADQTGVALAAEYQDDGLALAQRIGYR